ncbi:MAG: putative toxin-antitoxin system toxin component, PIN family [Verrucomicrobiota bacterium]
MVVCIDTNVILKAFARGSSFAPLFLAVGSGKLRIALSTSILLEYEEISQRTGGADFASKVMNFLSLVSQVHGTVLFAEPSFQFRIIHEDPDDNKFTDCAITADAEYVITEDADFLPLRTAGYKPQPITPTEFIARHLS